MQSLCVPACLTKPPYFTALQHTTWVHSTQIPPGQPTHLVAFGQNSPFLSRVSFDSPYHSMIDRLSDVGVRQCPVSL